MTTTLPLAVVVHGAEGRMGRLVAALVEAAPDCALVGLVTEPGRLVPAGVLHPTLPAIGQDAMAMLLPSGCVIIDFSLAPALPGLLAAADQPDAHPVSGTTRFTAGQHALLQRQPESPEVVPATNFSIYGLGAAGAISVVSNLLPGTLTRMWKAFAAGDLNRAWPLARSLDPVCNACFVETNPVPVKELLSMAGLCRRDPRLPLVPVSEKSLTRLVQFYEGTLAAMLTQDTAGGCA